MSSELSYLTRVLVFEGDIERFMNLVPNSVVGDRVHYLCEQLLFALDSWEDTNFFSSKHPF